MVDLNNVKIAFFDLEDESIHDLITKCQECSVDMYLVSYIESSTNISEKLEWFKKTYNAYFELCSAASIELAITVMETMTKLRGYSCNEVLLVSTNVEAVELAKQKGFLVFDDLTENFVITPENRHKIGYTKDTVDLVIPDTFYDEEDGVWYKVTKIGGGANPKYGAFSNTNLTSVSIPNSVTTIGAAAFRNCTSLESIVIPDSVITIGDAAFNNCTNLTSIEIPNSVTTIGKWAFMGSGLVSVEIPNSVIEIGEHAFFNCRNLKSVVIPDSVITIGENAFSCCWKLESAVIGSSVTEISDSAFAYCSNLKSINIPDSVTTIGNWAFAHCTSLSFVTIPDSVAEIGKKTFLGCSFTLITVI